MHVVFEFQLILVFVKHQLLLLLIVFYLYFYNNILILSLYSENPEYDDTFLQNYANINILPKIKRVPGVGDAIMRKAQHAVRPQNRRGQQPA